MNTFREREQKLKEDGKCVFCKGPGGKPRSCCDDTPSFCDLHYRAHLEIAHGFSTTEVKPRDIKDATSGIDRVDEGEDDGRSEHDNDGEGSEATS